MLCLALPVLEHDQPLVFGPSYSALGVLGALCSTVDEIVLKLHNIVQ